MEILLVWAIVGIVFTIIWAISGEKWNKDKRVILYKKLMSKGCIHCHGKLGLGDFTQQYMNIECDDCGSVYQVDTMVEMAWEIDDAKSKS